MATDTKDQELLRKGRRNTLEDVSVPLREQIVDELVNRLERLDEGKRTIEIWETGNQRRGTWLARQERLMLEYDEFLEPIYDSPYDWSSNLHLPTVYTVGKTFHARFMSALWDIDPPFSMKSRTAAFEENTAVAEGLMRYSLRDWANHYQGIEDELDAWVWRWTMGGCGILKARWERKYSRFVDVVETMAQDIEIVVDEETGQERARQIPVIREEEMEVVEKVFDGPCIENVEPEDVLVVGGKGDPQRADEVLHMDYLTAGTLWSLVDQGVFREKAVREVIKFGESDPASESNTGTIKLARAQAAGIDSLDTQIDHARYSVIERYARIDVDGSGIPADVVMWVHKETGAILRATYLFRVMKSGLRPFFKIDFHKRHGQDYGVGLAEILYTLAKELDAIHNMKVDSGLISTMPFGFYRATSSIAPETIPFEPGSLTPLDNPQSDIYFPQLGNRAVFTAQEEQFLMGQIARVTSIDDLNLGIIGGQGVTRTATGARALLGESNANLNVFLRRLNRGWKQCLAYLFEMLQMHVEPGFQFRLTGEDGRPIWHVLKTRDEIAGRFDFEVDANSANSNKQVQVEVANELYQITGNPLDIQLGLITPLQRYEALKNLLQVRGIKDFNRFLRKPTEIQRIFTPEEVANRVLRGVDVPFTPEQDLQGFISYFEEIIGDDMLLGQFNEEQTLRLAAKAQEAQAMLQALQQQQAQAANMAQMRMNSGMEQAGPTAFNAPIGGRLGE